MKPFEAPEYGWKSLQTSGLQFCSDRPSIVDPLVYGPPWATCFQVQIFGFDLTFEEVDSSWTPTGEDGRPSAFPPPWPRSELRFFLIPEPGDEHVKVNIKTDFTRVGLGRSVSLLTFENEVSFG